MTVIARFEVIPVREGSMSTAIASALRALDRHPVSYETTATDTIIEADTVDQVFDAVKAAHQAILDDRVITSVEIDEDRSRPQHMHERVASVERELGHPPQRHEQPRTRGVTTQPPGRTAGRPTGMQSTEQQTGMQSSGQPSGMQSSGQPSGMQSSGQPSGMQSSGRQREREPTGRPMNAQRSGATARYQPPEQPPRPHR